MPGQKFPGFLQAFKNKRFMLKSFLQKMAFLTAIMLVLAPTACVRKAEKEEARKYLKAFDGELSLHGQNMMDLPGFKALASFYALADAPLPFKTSNITYEKESLMGYSLAKAAGSFWFDADSMRWQQWEQAADSIPLRLMMKNKQGDIVAFRLREYEEATTALQMVFPTRYKASILKNGFEIAKISYVGSVEQGVPKSAVLNIYMADYQCNINLSTSRKSKTSADVRLDFMVKREEIPVLQARIKTKALFTQAGSLEYQNLQSAFKVFPLEVQIKSKNQNFPEGERFIEAWNRSSLVRVFSNEGVLLGTISLARRPDQNRLQLLMDYNDGSHDDLETMLLLVKQILNFKLVHSTN